MKKKLSLLFGALGGAMAGYLFSKSGLRKELGRAKNADEVAKILGAHLQHDGRKLGHELMNILESEEVRGNVKKAKRIAMEYFGKVKHEAATLARKQSRRTSASVSKRVKRAKRKLKEAVQM